MLCAIEEEYKNIPSVIKSICRIWGEEYPTIWQINYFHGAFMFCENRAVSDELAFLYVILKNK